MYTNMKSEEEQRQGDSLNSLLDSQTGEFSLAFMTIPFPQELICSGFSDLTPLSYWICFLFPQQDSGGSSESRTEHTHVKVILHVSEYSLSIFYMLGTLLVTRDIKMIGMAVVLK